MSRISRIFAVDNLIKPRHDENPPCAHRRHFASPRRQDTPRSAGLGHRGGRGRLHPQLALSPAGRVRHLPAGLPLCRGLPLRGAATCAQGGGEDRRQVGRLPAQSPRAAGRSSPHPPVGLLYALPAGVCPRLQSPRLFAQGERRLFGHRLHPACHRLHPLPLRYLQ